MRPRYSPIRPMDSSWTPPSNRNIATDANPGIDLSVKSQKYRTTAMATNAPPPTAHSKIRGQAQRRLRERNEPVQGQPRQPSPGVLGIPACSSGAGVGHASLPESDPASQPADESGRLLMHRRHFVA